MRGSPSSFKKRPMNLSKGYNWIFCLSKAALKVLMTYRLFVFVEFVY